MKVFLSWSGDRSKHIAETFKSWLPKVIQVLKPWLSTDIQKGGSWDEAIHKNLRESEVAIVCLTSDNLKSLYLHYEVGAIANTEGALAATFLFDIEEANVNQPLSRFQNTKFTQTDLLKLLKDINAKTAKYDIVPLTDKELEEQFAMWWPKLVEQLNGAPAAEQKAEIRKSDDKIDEVLAIVRGIQLQNFNPITDVKAELLPLLDKSKEKVDAFKYQMETFRALYTTGKITLAEYTEIKGNLIKSY